MRYVRVDPDGIQHKTPIYLTCNDGQIGLREGLPTNCQPGVVTSGTTSSFGPEGLRRNAAGGVGGLCAFGGLHLLPAFAGSHDSNVGRRGLRIATDSRLLHVTRRMDRSFHFLSSSIEGQRACQVRRRTMGIGTLC